MKDIPVRSIQPKEIKANAFDSFKIRSVKTILDGQDMQQNLHRHDFYFILAIGKGVGVHEIDFVEHQVTDYSISFMRPGQVHRLKLKAGSDGYLIEFSKDFQLLSPTSGAELLRKASSNNYSIINEHRWVKLHSILESILEEYTFAGAEYQNAIKAALELFLINFLRAHENLNKQTGTTNVNLYRQEKLQEFFDLLESNISTIKKVSTYADMLNLSQFQLNSTTKTLIGKTAAELIDNQVILEAKRYLLATSNQVNQISNHLGYEDVSYFIRFFKKHTGHSPEAFRQNFR